MVVLARERLPGAVSAQATQASVPELRASAELAPEKLPASVLAELLAQVRVAAVRSLSVWTALARTAFRTWGRARSVPCLQPGIQSAGRNADIHL